MKRLLKIAALAAVLLTGASCNSNNNEQQTKEEPKTKEVTAKDILGNPKYLAISYGGYRQTSRSQQPTAAQLQDDIRILHAMGIRVLRTYNVQLAHASNVLHAIRKLKEKDPTFEMYVMLGAWIDCKNAWTEHAVDHNQESQHNESEIGRAVALANQHPDIVKVIAVGNEAMVKWAESYYVQPSVILKWVNHLQEFKKIGRLPEKVWITCSDDYSSWGGGDTIYHTPELEQLMNAVDYISMHTYPFHNTHYHTEYWKTPSEEAELSDMQKVESAMKRSQEFAANQYQKVKSYMKSLGINKPIHIGETGWATKSDGFYGPEGSRAADEYKQAQFYKSMREWSAKEKVSCFFFEAFDEPWKDANNPNGSENYFGIFDKTGQAKFALWDLVDQGTFKGFTRDGNPIEKTFAGKKEEVMKSVQTPPANYNLVHQ